MPGIFWFHNQQQIERSLLLCISCFHHTILYIHAGIIVTAHLLGLDRDHSVLIFLWFPSEGWILGREILSAFSDL